jgi:hypothetical protein
VTSTDRAPRSEDRAPAWARWFVGAFLLAFVVCGLTGIEAWPLTGWRLFSHVRTEHQTTWRAAAVDAAGGERGVAFAGLPVAYKGFTLIMSRFDELSVARREETCRAWARAVGRSGQDIESLRLYRLDRDLVPRRAGRPATPAGQTLAYECDAAP